MQIPDYKKPTDILPVASSSRKTAPLLAQIVVHRSRGLITFYKFVYGALAISFLVAFYPWLKISSVGWCALIVIQYLLLNSYRSQRSVFEGALWYERGYWYTKSNGRVDRHLLSGEVVCWSPVIILRLRNTSGAKIKTLVITTDSLSPSDNSRLRTWLRVRLKPKG